MQEMAGGWLDERLDAEPRWTRADADLVTEPDLESEAGALLDRFGEPDGDVTAAVLDRNDAWLAGREVGLGDAVDPADEIVVVADDVADALEGQAAELSVSDDGTWLPTPSDATPPASVASVDDGGSGIVDPFDVFLATTEPMPPSEDPVGERAGDPTVDDEPSLRNEEVADDIAPPAEERSAGEQQQPSVDEETRADDTPGPADLPLAVEPGPPAGPASRLDAFDVLDPADAIEPTDPGGLGPDTVADADAVEDPSDDLGGDAG